jgi:hypothetical protein
MTRKETIDIIKQSSLWDTLSVKEKVEAISYALESIDCRLDRDGDTKDVSDIIGEIYSG